MFIDSTESIISVTPHVQQKLLQSVEMDFGTWLKNKREEVDLTQGELSERTDKAVSVSMISSIEVGTRNASAETVDRLARALGADINEARRIWAKAFADDPIVEGLLQKLRKSNKGLSELTDDERVEVAEEMEYQFIRTIERILARRERS